MCPKFPSTSVWQPQRLCAVVLAAALLGSCEQKDPGVQAELIQLKAERNQLTNRIQELESSVQSKDDEIKALKSSVSKTAKGDSFDKQASMTSFITRVSELKSEIQREFPDGQLSDSVQMPSFDSPLQSEVAIDVRRPGQPAKSFLWTGRGKLTGEWVFSERRERSATSNTGVDSNTTARNNSDTAASGNSAASGSGDSGASGSESPDTGSASPDTGNSNTEQPPAEPNDIPDGSRLVREDPNGKVWLTPDGRYIIKLNQ